MQIVTVNSASIIETVVELRSLQREYMRTKNKDMRLQLRKLEEDFDGMLDKFLKEKVKKN